MITQLSFGFPKYQHKGPKRHEDTLNQLRHNGWHQIGEGHFSKVFGHDDDPGRAIKVSEIIDAWPVYAKLAMTELVEHPNVLSVYTLDYHRSEDMGYYIAEMERLDEMPSALDLEAERLWHQYDIVRSGLSNWRRLPQLTEPEDYQLFNLGQYLRRHNSYSIDLHDRNIMVREKTLVVTDPWAWSY